MYKGGARIAIPESLEPRNDGSSHESGRDGRLLDLLLLFLHQDWRWEKSKA